jgi:PEP-CTERM motif
MRIELFRIVRSPRTKLVLGIAKSLAFALAVCAVFPASSHARAQFGLGFVEENHGGTESAYAHFGNDLDPTSKTIGTPVTPSTGTGEAWLFDFNGSGHSANGGAFLDGPWAWVEPSPSPLFNNLYYLGNNTWRLESEQLIPAPNTQSSYSIPGFPLGTSLNAGFDTFDGSQLFASVNEITVPEPSTVVLAGMGLLGLGFAALRKKYCRA